MNRKQGQPHPDDLEAHRALRKELREIGPVEKDRGESADIPSTPEGPADSGVQEGPAKGLTHE